MQKCLDNTAVVGYIIKIIELPFTFHHVGHGAVKPGQVWHLCSLSCIMTTACMCTESSAEGNYILGRLQASKALWRRIEHWLPPPVNSVHQQMTESSTTFIHFCGSATLLPTILSRQPVLLLHSLYLLTLPTYWVRKLHPPERAFSHFPLSPSLLNTVFFHAVFQLLHAVIKLDFTSLSF